MRTNYFVAVGCLLLATATHAENGVLVDHVPGGATPEIVVAVAKAALTNREWTITAVGPDSVTAELDHSQTKAKIRIVFSDWRVLYEGSAVTSYRTGQQQQVVLKKNTNIPDRWVTFLRRDISTALATIPEHR